MKMVKSVLIILVAFGINVHAQEINGTASGNTTLKEYHRTNPRYFVAEKISQTKQANEFTFATTTFTFYDLVVFSYFNDSKFYLSDITGAVIDSVDLAEDQFHVFSPGEGIYRLAGNNSFTLLIGDPVSNTTMGFFAVDESGRALATRLNTYMPDQSYDVELFIIFAYYDATGFTLRDLSTGAIIASGILDAGEHFQLEGYYNVFLGITANKPVSALSYADQGYFVPATNGTFAGTHFYGYSANLGSSGGWPNGIVITAYSDDTEYTVINTTTKDTITSGILNQGEATKDYVTSETYWEVITSKSSTVSNTPYAFYSFNYSYLTRQIDESGLGIGKNFYTPVTGGNMNIVSYEDENFITVTDLTTQNVVWQNTLNEGEGYEFFTANTVYHTTGTKNISVLHSFGGGFGADFMPLNFTIDLPDLAISTEDIEFDPDIPVHNPGNPITLKATVHNFGNAVAENVNLRFFDGDPDGGVAISDLQSLTALAPGENYTFSFAWTVPDNPKYHAVYALVDPADEIIESNSSNNLAFKFIIPNDDLLPPLTTTVEAPTTLLVENDIPEFSEFDITVTIFNTGAVTATNAIAVLSLPSGLALTEPAETQEFGSMGAGQKVTHTWTVMIENVSEIESFFYEILVDSDNSTAKILERQLIINRILAIDKDLSSDFPISFSLQQNFPNPFNPLTTIEYSLPITTNVTLEIFNIIGGKVKTLVDEIKPAGVHRIDFEAGKLSSGIYFVSIKANNFHAVRKMTLLK
jgi:hypothetical protein